jgi:hexosaminidase
VKPSFPNLSVLVMHLYFPQLQLGRSFTDGLTAADLRAVEERLTDAVARLARARPRRADGALVVEELGAGAALVSLMCRDARARLEGDGWLASVPEQRRRQLASELEPLIETHRRLWLARNRPGGLDDSAAWLEHLRECYLSGTTERGWGGW